MLSTTLRVSPLTHTETETNSSTPTPHTHCHTYQHTQTLAPAPGSWFAVYLSQRKDTCFSWSLFVFALWTWDNAAQGGIQGSVCV